MLGQFCEIWLCHFEFTVPDGERPTPLCMVAIGLKSGREIRLWADRAGSLVRGAILTGPDALVVAYYASAELGCFLVLGWPLPVRILDLYAEFRVETNESSCPAVAVFCVLCSGTACLHLDADKKDEIET